MPQHEFRVIVVKGWNKGDLWRGFETIESADDYISKNQTELEGLCVSGCMEIQKKQGKTWVKVADR